MKYTHIISYEQLNLVTGNWDRKFFSTTFNSLAFYRELYSDECFRNFSVVEI